MMASMAEVRRFVNNIQQIRLDKLEQAKIVLDDIISTGKANIDERELLLQVNKELERRFRIQV